MKTCLQTLAVFFLFTAYSHADNICQSEAERAAALVDAKQSHFRALSRNTLSKFLGKVDAHYVYQVKVWESFSDGGSTMELPESTYRVVMSLASGKCELYFIKPELF